MRRLHLARLPIRIRDGAVHPEFLGPPDHAWLDSLLQQAAVHVGATWHEFESAMKRPLGPRVSAQCQGLAAAVLASQYRRRVQAAVPPAKVRELVFELAARGGQRGEIMAAAGARLGLDAESVERSLFADRPSERVVVAPSVLPSAAELAVKANLEMCRSLLMRATEVEIRLTGNAHWLVRRAQRRGLLWTLVSTAPDLCCLSLSGPLRLFRRTTRYGHALGALLPALADCPRFDLVATLVLGDREIELRLRTGDPFLPAYGETKGGSWFELGNRLGRDEWIVVRDAGPIELGRRLLFPDLALVSRRDASCQWFVERVGFWTTGHLEGLQASYAAAGIDRLILCVEERLRCGEGDVPQGVRVVWHRGRVPEEEIWRIIEG